MNLTGLEHIRTAIQKLNPKNVRDLSNRPLNIALYAATDLDYERLEAFFVQDLGPARRSEGLSYLHRGPDPKNALQYDLAIYDESVLAPTRALVFHHKHPDRLVNTILETHDHQLALPLARAYEPFRAAYIEQVISGTCWENALFSLATALPDIIPSLIELPWAVTEFASDTAVLTANQIKMAFLIAAASDRTVGYREQKREIALVIGSAFGWRGIARQLVGKIPFGAGLIPKAGVAYAATKLVGASLERVYRVGYGYTRDERETIYKDAFEQGKRVAGGILRKVRPDLAKNSDDVSDLSEAK